MEKTSFSLTIAVSFIFLIVAGVSNTSLKAQNQDSIVLTSSSGTFDDGGYTNNVSRKWVIQPPEAVTITLSFVNFYVEDGYDFVRIYDGPTTASPLLASYTGDEIPEDVTSSGGEMLVHFTTDEDFYYGYGWSATYTSLTAYCSGTTTLDSFSGSFNDGSGSENYGNNSDCKWLIEPLLASTVTLNFTSFDVEETYDYVRVYDGGSTSAPLIGEYTGNALPPEINSTGNQLFVHFVSNESGTAPGWDATYEGINPSVSVSPEHVTLSSNAGDSTSFIVTSNTEWSVDASESWVLVEPDNGTDDDTVSIFALTDNTSINPRTAEVTVFSTLAEDQVVTVTQEGADPFLTIDVDTITLSANEQSSDVFNVSSNVSWNAISGEGWLSVSPQSDSANGVVTVITMSNNESASQRVTTVSLASPGLQTQEITVIQEGTVPCLSINPSNLTLNSAIGSSGTFDITSNVDWEIVSDQTWLDINPLNGANDSEITVLATSENASSSSRVANLTISGTDVNDHTVIITQQGTDPSLSILQDTVTIQSSSGSVAAFDIVSNVGWQVNTTSSWLSINPENGFDNGNVTLTADTENTNQSARLATVVVSCSELESRTLAVLQQGMSNELEVSTENVTLNSDANSTSSFDIYSNVSWNVNPDQSWLSVDPASGSNNSAVVVTAITENTNTGPRTAEINVSGPNVDSRTISVTQQGTSPALSVSTQMLTISSAEGGSGTFTITSNVDWTISDDQSWLDVSPSNGSNNSTIIVSANSANTAAYGRTGTVVVNSPNTNSKTITVIQEGTSPHLEISQNYVTLHPISGSNASFGIMSNLDWEIISNVPWLSMSPQNGTGDATINVSAESTNDATQDRYGMLTISGEDISKTVVVIQEQVQLLTSGDTLFLTSNDGAYDVFNIISNVDWSINDNASWIIADPNAGTGDNVITVTATNNNTSSEPRYATLNITSTYAEPCNVIVQQDGNTGISQTSFADSIFIYPNPVYQTVNIEIYGNSHGNLELIDTKGSIIKSQHIITTNNTLDVAALPAGIYYIRITQNEQKYVKKIIKK